MLRTDLVCVSVKLVAKGFTHSLDFMLVGRCTAARSVILCSVIFALCDFALCDFALCDSLRSFRGLPRSELDVRGVRSGNF